MDYERRPTSPCRQTSGRRRDLKPSLSLLVDYHGLARRHLILLFAGAAAAERRYVGRTRVGMATVTLSIQGRLCGPISIGTVDVIKAVQTHAGLGLGEAKALIDRCVFDGETVATPNLSDVSVSLSSPRFCSLTDAPPIDVRID